MLSKAATGNVAVAVFGERNIVEKACALCRLPIKKTNRQSTAKVDHKGGLVVFHLNGSRKRNERFMLFFDFSDGTVQIVSV